VNIGGLGSTDLGFFGTDGEWLKKTGKGVYTAAVGISLALLLHDSWRAKKIVRTRDISLAVTNNIAYR
jgi:hypothetical protein